MLSIMACDGTSSNDATLRTNYIDVDSVSKSPAPNDTGFLS